MCLIWLLQCTLLGCIMTKLHTYISQKKSTCLCSTGPFSASPSNITIPMWLIWPLYLKQCLWLPLTPTFWSLYPLHILQSIVCCWHCIHLLTMLTECSLSLIQRMGLSTMFITVTPTWPKNTNETTMSTYWKHGCLFVIVTVTSVFKYF